MPSTSTAPRRPFVGRRAELEVLRAHLGRGRLIVVTGEPGIGKTRLAEEFAAEAAAGGAAVHWGRCWEGDGAPAFWPWIQIARDHARSTDDTSVRTAMERALGDLEGRIHETVTPPALDPAPARFRLFDTITTLLVTAATARPLVLVLEDLHWADMPSLVLLQFLVRHARTAPVLVVATYRDVEIGKTHPLSTILGELASRGERMPLAGLGANDVEAYVTQTLGDERGRALADRLHHETEGHPFFVVESVRLLETSGAAAITGVPDSIRELIARRLRQRSESCREMLSVAAIVGRDFSLSVLRRLAQLARHDVLALIGEALDGRLVVAAEHDLDTYRFSHALIREALYSDTPLARRTQLHREIGEAIAASTGGDDDEHVAELAHHFREAAADGDVEAAVRYGILAGGRATQALAHEEAVAHYERTLQLLERCGSKDETRHCELLLALGFAQVRAGDPPAATATLERVVALARELRRPEDLSRAALGLGEIERQSERVVPILEEALTALDDTDSVLRSRLLSRLSVALYWARSDTRKRALSDEAVAMARRLGYAPTLAYALSSRLTALSGPDDVRERLAVATEMVAIAEQCDHHEFALIGRGFIIADTLALGDLPHARFAIAAFATMATASRHPYFMWWLTAIRTMEAILAGRLDEAEPLAQKALALGQRAIPSDAIQVFATQFYVLCRERQLQDQIEPIVRGIVEQFPELPGAHSGLALLHADRGKVEEARAEMDLLAPDRFAMVPRNPDWLNSISTLVLASVELPGAPHAATLYELLAPYRTRIVVSGLGILCLGSVSHYLGLLATRLGRFDDAEACFEEAVAAEERLEAPAWCAYTRYEQAVLYLTRRAPGDEARAAALVAAARPVAEAHGMRRLVLVLDALPVAPNAAAPEPTPVPPPRPRRTALLRKEGDYWRLGWEQSEFRLADRVGLRYLATLIGSPGREFLAVDLVRSSSRTPAPHAEPARIAASIAELGGARPLASAEAALDPHAERAYRARLAELRHVLEEARRDNDLGRIAEAESETDALTREIARSIGLGSRGRDSRSPIERARVSATRAIKAAIRLIQDEDHSYGRHLGVTVKTGTFCSYVPDPELTVTWRL